MPSCGTTKLKVTANQKQSSFDATEHTSITLVPRKAKLVAVLETDAQRVAYTETVTLRASRSYDPDKVQVTAVQFVQAEKGTHILQRSLGCVLYANTCVRLYVLISPLPLVRHDWPTDNIHLSPNPIGCVRFCVFVVVCELPACREK